MEQLTIEEIVLAITLFLLAAKILGEIVLRLHQPALLGELAAGIIIGPQLLGRFIFHAPIQNCQTLNTISEIGAVFFFFIIGYSEIDLNSLKRIAKNSLIASMPNVLLSFIFGYLIGIFWEYSFIASMFIGLALSLTAIGVSARTLMDLGRLHTDYGMLILGEAIIDALRSLLTLSILILFVHPEAIFSAKAVFILVLKFVGFFISAFLFKLIILKPLTDLVSKFLIDEAKFGIMIGIILLFSYVSQILGLHTIIGAFVAGIIFALQAEFKTKDLEYKVYGLSYGLFVPLFFSILGAKINFSALGEGGILAIAVIIIAIAVKLLGGYLGALSIGYSSKKSWVVGCGLIPRTGVELVVIAVALEVGLIDDRLFASIVAMVAVTVFITPFLLKFAIGKLEAN
ncbi:MAG: cation:proton antiporter [bacterium]|nr:MAG: cation:proton antiporter [bacterium]